MPAQPGRPPGVYASGKSHYQYRITLPTDPETGKRRQVVRGGFASAEEAYVARAAHRARLGLEPDAPAPRVTVAEYMAAFIDAHELLVGASSALNFRWAMGHVVAGLGAVPIDDLTPERVRAWVTALARDRSASTARLARAALVQALNQAVADRRLAYNAAALVKAPRHTPRPRTVLDDDEIERFVTAAEADKRAAFWLACLFGQLRPGEAAGLRWPDVDLRAGVVTVRITRTRDRDSRFVLGDRPKSPSSRRRVALPAICADALREHRRRQAEERLAAPPGWWSDHDLVFPNRRGGVLGPDTINKALRVLCARAGVPRLTPHELRHTGASWARRAGVRAEVLQRRLGHKDIETTLGIYVHETDGDADQRDAATALEAALRSRRRDRRRADDAG